MATPRLQSESEAELLARVRDGEPDAFYELVRPYERGIYLAALSIVNNDADAEEVVQEAILKAFKAIGSFRAEAKFSTWLIQITMNEARMKLRKDRRHLYESLDQPKKGEDDGDYVPRDFADWREIPSEALENARLRECLKKGLASLSAKYRQVLILRDIEHLNIAETAKLIGISESAVKTRLLRARLMMRDALAPGFDGAWKKGRQYEKVRPW
ncbi:MAG: sigma-70 family RNA polymerase sigma factor [Terriglobales bacterium]